MPDKIGTTSYEAEQLTGLSHQTVSARRSELRQWGYTDYLLNERGARVTRLTDTGRNAYVEIATDKGKTAIQYGWRIHDGPDPTLGRHGGNPMSDAAFQSTDLSIARWEVLKTMVARTP
jgi:hypothetical protein